ncbi:hypothetical protein AYO21_05216 [Fonsecaea monophora]|uniref:Transcriptional coactivator HFI1/ADA1 n=1 Tax=Fonsecaea monophora TaxID=254056 RepID=A0A177F8I9_9EURO|nr:hypothetical protein AYO21_05216 [Fonsecaea monophora]KAH0833539.1 transcriptional co-activator (Hfi1/Ada1) [Fonsecaea pedrosoi]OAG40515.1 hypothetical protein AYO21_05216 [Fonsecaea monophora]
MATFDETFNPAALTRSDTITSTTTTTKPPPGSASKQPKAAQSYPRVDLEPLYTELKSLIGHNWDTYFDAITRFIRGELNAREFGDLCDVFIYATPQTEHAHNSLILAILCNTGRDPPEPGLAAWVSATTDKSALTSGTKATAISDASEQRLKAEVMALPARDRRRIKGAANEKADEEAAARRNPYEELYLAGRIKAPETAPSAAAGGLTKTNWDLEIRKRYVQPLFSETLEFPDTPTIHSRIVPICYEESVAQGCSIQCAELVGIAAETYLKTLLAEVVNRTRSNGPRYEHSAGGGILTSSYKKKIDREEEEVKAGRLNRTRDDDLLPTEAQVAYARRPIGIADLQLTTQVGPVPWNAMPCIAFSVSNASAGYDHDQWLMEQEEEANAAAASTTANGHIDPAEDGMDVDNTDNYGWEGAGPQDRSGLDSVLADCLAIRV